MQCTILLLLLLPQKSVRYNYYYITVKIKGYFNIQLVTGVSVQLYFPQCWFVFPAYMS